MKTDTGSMPSLIPLSLILLFVFCLLSVPAAADALFAEPLYLDVAGDQVLSIKVGDFDGQNGPDMAVVSYQADKMSILLNDGLGVFYAPVDYNAGNGPTCVQSGDFDSDGILDLAVGSWDERVRIYTGQGDGTFEMNQILHSGINPWDMVVADLDGVNGPDIACSCLGGNPPVFSVYLNNGNGIFSRTDYPTETGQRGMACGDFDGVNGPDLVLALYATDQLAVHLNNGSGGFGEAITLGVEDKPYDLWCDDLDHNGTMDLIVIHKNEGRDIWAIPGLGMGQFGFPLVWHAEQDMDCLMLADLDDDGDDDLLVTSSSGSQVGILMQPNDGNWGQPVFHDGGEGAYATAAGDFDDDGDMDVVVSSYWTSRLAILENMTYNVPVMVSQFDAVTAPGRVQLNWTGWSDEGEAEFRVLARRLPDGVERMLTATREVAPNRWELIDRDISLFAGGQVQYRLQGLEQGVWLSMREMVVTVPAAQITNAAIEGIWPNPANPVVNIGLVMPEPTSIQLAIYDMNGRLVKNLASGITGAGSVIWRGLDHLGQPVASGVYLVNLRAEGVNETRRVVLLR